MKLTKQDIDKVRHIEGFPIAKEEDIIALSNPPHYTACPNPFIEEFIKEHSKPYDEETDDYHREPFAADVSEGKNDIIYNAHNYHTKVPYKAIMRYILHYTEPGDIVFDGFSGTGTTGVAAQMCGVPEIDSDLKYLIEKDIANVEWGSRKAILSDLSPIAAFISHNYNTPVNVHEYKKATSSIMEHFEKECGWMYETFHLDDKGNIMEDINGPVKGKINYTVWSDVFICPNCGHEIIFYNVATDKDSGKVFKEFTCSKCNMELQKKDCTRAKEIILDKSLNKELTLSKQVPVLINYSVGKSTFSKVPDSNDISVINKIDTLDIPYWYPANELPEGYNTEQPKRSHGITHAHVFYTRRNLFAIAFIFNQLRTVEETLRNHLIFTFEQILYGMSKLARYVPTHYSQVNQYLSGTLYIGSQVVEVSPGYILNNKIKNLVKVFTKEYCKKKNVIVSTNSLVKTNISTNSIDYIFTDPPFGNNLNYSELSFLWESWLRVLTNNKTEAIVNNVQNKGLVEYQEIMTDCFLEYYRVLKPNRWMSVVFHNSKNAVWNAIQEALNRVGFVIADVRTLDKKQGSFKQVTTTSAVKQDLVITVYKPKESFKRKMIEQAGNEETAWGFVRQHLEKLPIVVKRNDKIELITERQGFLLFDRMVAYHIMNGIQIPLDASDFYKGLDEKFLKRDEMYFLHDQVNDYDTARITADVETIQMALFVSDEKSAIAWLYQQLDAPQTYAEIQPKFMKEVRSIEKHEKLPELSILLEDNFLQDDQGKWYIPDVTKAADVMKLREKKLIKEFEEYLNSTGKLKQFRTEAIRAGFAKLWKEKNYGLIVKTAERLPETVIQEDDKLLMYYDISLSRI